MASTSAHGQPPSRPSKSLRKEAETEKAKVCDRLIALFQEKPVKEWRQLMAFSKQWPMLRARYLQPSLPFYTFQISPARQSLLA